MDCFQMTLSGRITKVNGWVTDRQNREFYRFGMACNRQVGKDQETLFLRVDVPDPLANIVAERGVSVGEGLLIMTAWAQLAAVIVGNVARPYLNVQAAQVFFLTNDKSPALERGAGFEDRIIDFNLLLAIKGQKVG